MPNFVKIINENLDTNCGTTSTDYWWSDQYSIFTDCQSKWILETAAIFHNLTNKSINICISDAKCRIYRKFAFLCKAMNEYFQLYSSMIFSNQPYLSKQRHIEGGGGGITYPWATCKGGLVWTFKQTYKTSFK